MCQVRSLHVSPKTEIIYPRHWQTAMKNILIKHQVFSLGKKLGVNKTSMTIR